MVTYKNRYEYPSISFESKVELDPERDDDYRVTRQEGRDGEKEKTYRVKYVDNIWTSEKLIKIETIREPTTEIIVKGTKKKVEEPPPPPPPPTIAGWASGVLGINEDLVYPFLFLSSLGILGATIAFVSYRKRNKF